MSRRSRPPNRWGCKPDGDVCVAHDQPLECRHGCAKALEHECSLKTATLADLEAATNLPAKELPPNVRPTLAEILHVLRNPHGWSEDSVRQARLAAAEEIERLNISISDGSTWIPVGERKPEAERPVLLYSNVDGIPDTPVVGAWDTDDQFYIGQQPITAPWVVTHWMPLPEAPK